MLLKTVCLVVLLAISGSASEGRVTEIGLRAAEASNDHRGYFRQMEVFVIHELPWTFFESGGFNFGTNIYASAGVLNSRGLNGVITTAGPGFVLSTMEDRFVLEIGSIIGLLNRYRYEKLNFGGMFQFISYIGVSYRLQRHIRVGYRFQHMSNAGIIQPNPGLNLYAFELIYSL